MSAPEFAAGHVVDNKYEIQALLGHSGPVATYRAIMGPKLQVALKFYDPRLEMFPDVAKALALCETVTSELPEDFVARIVDGGKDPATGALYTVTHFDTDASLGELVTWGPLSPSEVVAFAKNMARALDAVHARGIAHLSLKPTNVFVGPRPLYNVRLVDFAMSLVRDALQSPQERAASLQWLAPEQVGGAIEAGPAADVFASALVAFHALTGASYWRSFESGTPDESAFRPELCGSRTPVSKRARELSVSLDSAFDQVFERALAVAPEERFGTAGEFAEALAAAMQANLAGEELERFAPTSTSAVILAPSSAPAAGRPPLISKPVVVVDVPPPPAQMEAVLAAFETAAPERLRSTATSASATESVGVQASAGSTAKATERWSSRPTTRIARRWSSVIWIGGAAAGVLIAAGIVRAIVGKEAPDLTPATSAPAASIIGTSEGAPPVESAITPNEDVAPSTAAPAGADSRARTTTAKPASKTVQPRGAASSATRKPCGKLLLKPCK